MKKKGTGPCFFLLLLCACEGTPRPRAAQEARGAQEALAPGRAPPRAEAVIVNRTLIYPVQNGRAEDLAAALGPFLEARFGPGVRVVPHRHTNQLLIYVPTREERERARGTPPGKR